MSGFGGHGERGAAIAICCWVALGLPRAAIVAAEGQGVMRSLGFGLLVLGAVAAWVVIRRLDEGVGCLSAIGIGVGFWAASRLAQRLAFEPVHESLATLVGALVGPFVVVGALLGSARAWDSLVGHKDGAGRRPAASSAKRSSPPRVLPAASAVGTQRETARESDDLLQRKKLHPGQRFGPFRIQKRIETDGFLSVYQSTDDSDGVTVYLQCVDSVQLLEDFDERRFVSDAERLAALRHAHLVGVRGFGVEGSVPWLAFDRWLMETLADLLHRGRLETARALALINAVASALDVVHAAGLCHGSLRPQLVQVADDDILVSGLDLGWLLRRQASEPALVGNATYHSPEELTQRHAITARSDIYRLGLMAFECLTGRRPFEYEGLVSNAMKKLELQIAVPPNSTLDEVKLDVLRRCLAPEPEARWPTATAFSSALTGSV